MINHLRFYGEQRYNNLVLLTYIYQLEDIAPVHLVGRDRLCDLIPIKLGAFNLRTDEKFLGLFPK